MCPRIRTEDKSTASADGKVAFSGEPIEDHQQRQRQENQGEIVNLPFCPPFVHQIAAYFISITILFLNVSEMPSRFNFFIRVKVRFSFRI